MLCIHCSHDNPAGNRFCGYCGAKLETPADADLLRAERTPPSWSDRSPRDEANALLRNRNKHREEDELSASVDDSRADEVLDDAKARPLDLRDPTDPGRIVVPANGRNATHVPADEPL